MDTVMMGTVTRVRQDRVRCRIAPSALALLESARQGIASAQDDMSPGGRYVGAHLAALRAAAQSVDLREGVWHKPALDRARRRPLLVNLHHSRFALHFAPPQVCRLTRCEIYTTADPKYFFRGLVTNVENGLRAPTPL